MHLSPVTPPDRSTRAGAWFARVAAVLVLALGMGALSAPAAFAADAALTVSKTVDGQESVAVDPGDEFSYLITVGCDDGDCVDARLVDALPAEFAGFDIVSSSVSPPSQPATTSFSGCTTVVTANCSVTVDFETALDNNVSGLRAGDTQTLTVTLRAPLTLSPTWESNGDAVTNTAVATSTTATTVGDTAVVTVAIPITVDLAVGKTWSPAQQQFSPGVQSTVGLTVRNTSNVAAESILLQDPKAAAPAAASLDASNPFTIVDFVSFGAVTAPQGADLVRVDAYVFAAGAWGWVVGSPSAVSAVALPATVQPADVAGLRFEFSAASTGATIAPAGSAGSVQFVVAQRGTHRTSGDSLVLGTTATNQVTGTVTVPGSAPVSRDASAPYRIAGLTVDVTAGKTITPSRIPAGTTATAVISGKNDSNGPLTSLTLGDTGFFTAELAFGGFTAPVAYPSGATAATIEWSFSDGSTVAPVAVAAGSTPVAPAPPTGTHLTGFSVTYTGAIAAASVTSLSFAIAPSAAFVPSMAASPVTVQNTVRASGTNPAGTDAVQAVAPLSVFFPDIDLTIDKSIAPTGAVNAGGTVVVQLPTTTSTDSAFVKPTRIVVEDVWRSARADDFWGAFSPVAIAPTQVIANSSLRIEYTTDGTTWIEFDSVPATSSTVVYSKAISGVDTTTITGLRYTFENPAGLAQGTTVSPNTVFEARSTVRGTSTPTSVADAAASVYQNRGYAVGTGTVLGGSTVTSDEVADVANARIVSTTGAGSTLAAKDWTTASVVSQSGGSATTNLGWGVTATGAASVTITDPAAGGEATPADTAFQAFDLTRIRPVTFAQDPLLRWDTVTSVQLFSTSAGAWVPAAPGAVWMNGAGFTGYTLTAAQSADTTGVRLVVQPNDAARASSTNPLAPPVGSGVASGTAASPRPLVLDWALRNVARVGGVWVGESTFPSVENTLGVTVAGVETTDADSIALVDFEPAVAVTKTASAAGLTIPELGDVAPAGYPRVDFTVTAENESASRASYLRVSDPMPCSESTVASCVTAAGDWAADPYAGATYDPATNPFERLDLLKLTFTVPAGQVDKAASAVTLWIRDASGGLSRSIVTVAAAEAMTATQLAQVVGVSVVYQGTDPQARGGSIVSGADIVMVMGTRLRVYERSDAARLVTPFTIDNHTDAQSYDPVLFPSGPGSTPHDSAFAEVPLLTGRLDAVATKQISPDTMLQRDRATPVTVTLGASDGSATAAATTVTVTDVDTDFWDTYRLTSLGAVALPAGADRVRVDIQLDGASAWTTGTAAPAAVLPPVALDRVTGIRFTFDRADGALLSRTSPPADWTAGVVLAVLLRDTVRSTGDPVVFPSTIENEVVVSSSRVDGVFNAVEDAASDSITLATGSWQLDVAKSPGGNAHTVVPGTVVPWTLQFRNSGTGYLTVTDLTDQLPSHLTFDFENPQYATSAGGTLSTDVTYTYDQQNKRISFAWPDGDDLMAPGERFSITLGLTLEPGLLVSERATNQFVVTTAQPLAACTNTSGNGQGTLAGTAINECGTTNFVQPTPGASLATYKGVKGDVDTDLVSGAVNTSNPAAPCVVDSEGYYRTPCAANSAVGSTDEWKLLAVNSGTENYRSLTMVDPLPRLGDRLLATGGTRASTYQPLFDGDFGVVVSGAPAGSTIVWQVTTDAAPCVGSGATTWNSDPTCAANAWTSGAGYTGDWADVTALRVVADFATSSAGVLPPAGSVKVVYQSVNAPATAAFTGGAPLDARATTQFAWNQFGARAVLDGGATLQRAPVKVGVRLAESAVAVTKAVSGAAAAYAPGAYRVDLSCVVAGQPMDLGADAVLELSTAYGLTDRVDHLPLGATCDVAEQGAVGEFGESSRGGTPATIQLLEPTDALTPVPAAQLATVGNVYDASGLSVTKHVDTLATVGQFGSFDFALDCATSLGVPVVLPTSDASFSLRDGETHTATAGVLPVGSECVLTETGAGAATATAITGAGVVDAGDGSATVTIGSAAAVVTVANTIEAGTLSVVKTVTGDGAAGYGTGPFAASVDCTYLGAPVYSESALALIAGVPVTVAATFPVGTVCSVLEVVTGGATSHEDPPSVIIAGPVGAAPVGAVTVDVTNRFDVGSLSLVKERVGDGVDAFGAGPFEATVVCTWVRDGSVLTVPLAGGGLFSLSESNDYRVTVEGIVVGAECAVEETDAGLATATALEPTDGTVTIVDPAAAAAPATVTITNTFDVGRLELAKTADTTIAAVGGDVVYTLTARNTGQLTAHDVTVVDHLPAGARLVATSPAPDATTGDSLSWLQPELEVGQAAVFTVTLRFDTTGSHVNRASIVGPEGPWERPVVRNGCAADPSQACATVAVASLALTGRELPLTLLAFAAAALLAGFTLFGRSRRRPRH